MAHLVLETDSPYLAPAPFRGKRNETPYLVHIAERIAQLKNIPIEEVAAITTANASQIFNFHISTPKYLISFPKKLSKT